MAAQCPKCKSEITSLDAVTAERRFSNFTGSDWFHHDQIEFEIVRWKCPACHEELDIDLDEQSASEFLSEKPKVVALIVEVKGDYEIIYRCGNCESLNLDELVDETDQITCPDCGARNLRPQVMLCDCDRCLQTRNFVRDHEAWSCAEAGQ
ncbi:MAG: hypothetical protein ABSG90_12185 [Dehalococcoidia bacterium]|jgi:DNA-directed RNA polymerase subunit RPC12/RpoP